MTIILRIQDRIRDQCRMSRRGVAQASNNMVADLSGLFSVSSKKNEKNERILVRIGKWEHFSLQGLKYIDKAEGWESLYLKSPLLLLAECADE